MGTQMKMFMPSPDLAYNSTAFAWWENGFTNEELDAICIMGERASPQPAIIGQGVRDENIRGSTVSWLDNEGWLADKLQHIARQLNGKFFGLDLWGFGEQFQYTTYKYVKKSKQHYDWHMDNGPNDNVPRKLSMVLQLSHPSEYEGGDLELMTGNVPHICKKEKGLLYAFPSYIVHRVTPITNGTRRTLVVWTSGPRFK
jgi:PKHD-type hydroxylase